MSNATNTHRLVTLPKDVAAAIEALRDLEVNSYGIIYGMINSTKAHPSYAVLHEFFSDFDEESERHPIALMRALVNGYQVEKSAEELEAERKERVRDYYEYFYVIASNDDPGCQQHKAECKLEAIKETLDLLGIKIEGVND